PAYPPIDESDLGLYDYVRNYQGDQFIQHDRPEHLEMPRATHTFFTPKSMEAWRPFVREAVKELLDAAEEKGSMDVMRDLATPLPVLIIAEMMGVPGRIGRISGNWMRSCCISVAASTTGRDP